MDGYGNYTAKYPESITQLCGVGKAGAVRIRCARPLGHEGKHLGKRFNHIFRWGESAPSLSDELTARAEAAEDGLFRVVQALGFDMDGAKNAREFFGPMTYCTEEGRFTEPADIAVAFAKDHRTEMEEEADKYEAEIARLHAVMSRGFVETLKDRDEAYLEIIRLKKDGA